MAVPIQPLDDYVVVQAEEAATKSAAGLLLPDNAKEKSNTAKVVAVGANVKNVTAGDRVLYQNSYEATTVTVDGSEYTIVFHKNIIATVK